MKKWIIVELDTGEQEFFDQLVDAFRFAKAQEKKRRHSVELVGEFNYDPRLDRVYTGQDLRWILRSVDNVTTWMKSSDVR